MPSPAQMAGLPLQVGDLPPGTVVVRLIRGTFTSGVANHPIELHIGSTGQVLRVNTDDGGRAQFSSLQVGTSVQARAVVDSEELWSETFALPGRGGVRVMLAAGVGADPPGIAPPVVNVATPLATARPWGRNVWVATFIAIAAIATTGWRVWRGRRTTADDVSTGAAPFLKADSPPSMDREAIFARLVDLEDKWEMRAIPEGRYREERENLLRTLEAME